MPRLVVTNSLTVLGAAIVTVVVVLLMSSTQTAAAIMNLTCQPTAPKVKEFESWQRCVVNMTVSDMLNSSGANPSLGSAYGTCGRSPLVICQLPIITNESN